MDLIGREIFAVGKWNDIEFAEADIDDIVANFEKLGDTHKVPLKLGHNPEQKVTDGQPALGWVSKIYKQGQKLLADFTDMPSIIYDAMMKKLYRTVSVELLFNVDHKGTKYNHVLDGVAILGADQPAVNVLSDLNALLASRTSNLAGGKRVSFETNAGNRHSFTKDKAMDEKEIQDLIAKALAPIAQQVADRDATIATLQAEASKRDAADAEFARKETERKVTMARTEITKVMDDAVKAKTMTPAVRETYAKQIGVDDDKRVLEISVDQVKLMCGANKAQNDKEQGRVGDDNRETNPGDELLRLTNQTMASTGQGNFTATFARVCAANPELHREYLDSNGEK